MPIAINQDNFDTIVTQADKPVLLDFWASWCGPCRMLAPLVEELAAEHQDDLIVGKVDVDAAPELAQRFGIVSIPTVILLKDGQPVDKRIGYMPKEELEQFANQAR